VVGGWAGNAASVFLALDRTQRRGGRHFAGVPLLGGADGLLEKGGIAPNPSDLPGYERADAAWTAGLGEATFSAFRDEGRRTSKGGGLTDATTVVTCP
jgi:hypothetical protein